ncbi:seryl-tRNA synthetase [Spiroplasma sp. TIUS-1]|uniref:serine--tRNA ligase n=1 Tax=Spiroplasma sp. TIUS-1 TaxID=216963 RepID=UPI0013989FC2|nr:serine--tRNA ligase [Spiroplasma sp. TIUS-1]QHX35560.1 seryl-tRNA synthetase [Spiroplasma sp. TIUS-1]
MLDIKFLEENREYAIKQLNKRNADFTKIINDILKENAERKLTISKLETLKSEKNKLTKSISELMRNKDVSGVNKVKSEVEKSSKTIGTLEGTLKKIEFSLNEKLISVPNIPNKDIPIGVNEEQNIEVRKYNEEGNVSRETPHWDIATKLGLVDFGIGPKLSGSRFLVYTGKGSKMVRALADILLNHHTNNGYREMFVPVIVNPEAMYGTGQLPKFGDDAYKLENGQYLIPTSEVPLSNIYANEFIDEKLLPIKLTAFTQCFRKESGSAGRDTKGMIRLHQFNKVELVKMTRPEDSMKELELMVGDAEAILKLFKLPYRVVELCSGDIGFSSLKTYDLEVWFPEQNKYREISSCSNCGDFQAMNMKTKFKNSEGKAQYVHTLNGSGVAIDRLFAAILENYFDGEKLVLPDVLKPYFNNEKFIK